MKMSEYFKPKSLVYTGSVIKKKTTIHRFVYDIDHLDEFSNLKKEPKQYIQVVGLSEIEKINEIKTVFSIDEFIMEDVLNVDQRNKIEKVGDYVFACFSFLSKEQDDIKKEYMSLVFNQDVLISFHEKEPIFLAPILQLLTDYKDLKQGPIDFLFYHILDLITDDHLMIYDQFEQQLNAFEEEILETRQIEQEEFYKLRKHILQLKNISSPLFDQLESILKLDIAFIGNKTEKYYNDLIDHMKRLDDRLNQLKDSMRNLLDLDMNNQSTRMNRIMSTLTLFSAIFIPLSFLTGFFGMNFIHFNILKYEHAVVIFTSICLLIAVVMIMIFKKHKWF